MTKALKIYEYYLFVRWIATPEPLRQPGTQGEFQQLHKVSHQTLANWKNDPNFWGDVERELQNWGRERTPNVILGLYARASRKGDPFAVKLWLEYIQKWVEKTKHNHDHKVELGQTLADIIKQDLENAKNRQQAVHADYIELNPKRP